MIDVIPSDDTVVGLLPAQRQLVSDTVRKVGRFCESVQIKHKSIKCDINTTPPLICMVCEMVIYLFGKQYSRSIKPTTTVLRQPVKSDSPRHRELLRWNARSHTLLYLPPSPHLATNMCRYRFVECHVHTIYICKLLANKFPLTVNMHFSPHHRQLNKHNAICNKNG